MQYRKSSQSLAVALAFCLAAFLAACQKGPDDAALTTSVKSQLTAQSPALASMVNVETKEGVVTLTGTVDNDVGEEPGGASRKGRRQCQIGGQQLERQAADRCFRGSEDQERGRGWPS